MVNRANYHQAKAFIEYLMQVRHVKSISAERYWFHLKVILLWAMEMPFALIVDKPLALSRYLTEVHPGLRSERLAQTSVRKIIQIAQQLFRWLKQTQPKAYRSLSETWIESMSAPSETPASGVKEYVHLEDIKAIAALQIAESDLALRRDQAAACLLFLSGMRVSAFVSLPICGVVGLRGKEPQIHQWPELGVRTKNNKRATTFLLPIRELLICVQAWDAFIQARLPKTAMWYTPITSRWGEQQMTDDPPGKNRHVALAKRFRILFKIAGLPYKSPHKFRHGHAIYGRQHARNMTQYKALSKNLMHSDIRVTEIYSGTQEDEVKQAYAAFAETVADDTQPPPQALTDDALLRALAERLLGKTGPEGSDTT